MVTNSVFITTVVAMVVMAVSGMSLVVKVLGDRIADLGVRVSGIDTRMNAFEGALRDVGERLTGLATDLGKH